jgi:hypothetical protein
MYFTGRAFPHRSLERPHGHEVGRMEWSGGGSRALLGRIAEED